MNTPHPNPEPMDGGKIFAAALALLRQNFEVLVGVAFLMYMALWAVTGLTAWVLGVGTFRADFLFGPVISGVVLLVAADVLAGQPVTVRAHIARVMAVWGPVVVLSICAQIVIGLATLVFIFPGIYVAAGLFILLPVILFDNAGWDGWTQSWERSKPHIWVIFGILLRYIALGFLISLPFLFILSDYLLPAEDGTLAPMPILLEALVIFASATLSVFGTVLSLLVYRHINPGPDDLSRVFR